jgi:hypothetical protein
LLSLLWLGGSVWLALSDPEQRDLDRILITGFVGAFLGILLAALQGFRLHQWRLAADGIHIREGPKVPFTGQSRRDFVAWSDIAALETSGQNAVAELHVITRHGRRWSITQRAVSSKQSRFQVADPVALLGDLEAMIRTRVAQHRAALGPTTRALAFFESGPGITTLTFGFLISLPMAGATIWALWEGQRMTTGTRTSHDALALFLFGPILTAWGLIASLRRRRAILRARAEGANSRVYG